MLQKLHYIHNYLYGNSFVKYKLADQDWFKENCNQQQHGKWNEKNGSEEMAAFKIVKYTAVKDALCSAYSNR